MAVYTVEPIANGQMSMYHFYREPTGVDTWETFDDCVRTFGY